MGLHSSHADHHHCEFVSVSTSPISLLLSDYCQINSVFLVIALVRVVQAKRKQSLKKTSTVAVNFNLFKLVTLCKSHA